jgi:hypothetical protein
MTVSGRTSGRRARRWTLAVVAVVLLASAAGWWALKHGRPWLYGLEAYVYGFPLIMMDLTKEAATAVPTACRRQTDLPIADAVRMGQRTDAGGRAAGLCRGERIAKAIQADAA